MRQEVHIMKYLLMRRIVLTCLIIGCMSNTLYQAVIRRVSTIRRVEEENARYLRNGMRYGRIDCVERVYSVMSILSK